MPSTLKPPNQVSECPYIVATAEPSGRLSKGRGELKGVVNLFASLLQNEELPIEVPSQNP